MSEITVRPYAPSDREAVITLWNSVFADDPPWNNPADIIDTKLTVQPELFLIALLDTNVVGTTLAGFDGVRGWLHHVATAPDHRGLGIAEKLIGHAENALAALGCRKVNLQVRADNKDVVKFYEKLGYGTEERISLGKLLN